jgi:hypothetical protein
MKSWFVRCAGCGKQYSYNTHRHIRSRFSEEYCPECCAILGEALDKIRQQFVPRWMEIDYLENAPKILNATTEKKSSDSVIQIQAIEYVPNGMVSGNVHIIDGVKYAVCKDASGICHAFVWQEYDLEREAFGEKPWLVDGKNVIYPMMEPKPNGYSQDCGNGVWKVWNGVYGSKKFAEEVEEAIRKDVGGNFSQEN